MEYAGTFRLPPPPRHRRSFKLEDTTRCLAKKHLISSFLLQTIESFATWCSHPYFEQQQPQQQPQKLPAMLGGTNLVAFLEGPRCRSPNSLLESVLIPPRLKPIDCTSPVMTAVGCGMTALCWGKLMEGSLVHSVGLVAEILFKFFES